MYINGVFIARIIITVTVIVAVIVVIVVIIVVIIVKIRGLYYFFFCSCHAAKYSSTNTATHEVHFPVSFFSFFPLPRLLYSLSYTLFITFSLTLS